MNPRKKSEPFQHRTASTKKTRLQETGTIASPVEGRAKEMATPTAQAQSAAKFGVQFGPPDTLFNREENNQFTLTDPLGRIHSQDIFDAQHAFAASQDIRPHYAMSHVSHAVRQNPHSTAASSSGLLNGPVWVTTQPPSSGPSSSFHYDTNSSYANNEFIQPYVGGGWNSTLHEDEAVAPVELPNAVSTSLSRPRTLIYDDEGTRPNRSETPIIPTIPPPHTDLRPSPPGPPLSMDPNYFHLYSPHNNQNLPDPYTQTYNYPLFHLHQAGPMLHNQFPVVGTQETYPPLTQTDEPQNHDFSLMGLQIVPDISITDTSNGDTSPFTVPNPASAEPSTQEADDYWKAIFAQFRSAWEDSYASILQLIKNKDANIETLEPCLPNITVYLESLPAMFAVEDRRLLQDLLNRVRPEGTEAMRELKECLGLYAGNNIESIRDAVKAILAHLKTKNRFLAFYNEVPPPPGTQPAVRPSSLPTNSVLIRRRNKNDGSSQGKAADFEYKVLRCSNGNCTYCTHKTKKGTEYWRTRQDTLTHLLSSLLSKQRNLWICPACPPRSKPFSTKEVLRHHLTGVHHIPTSRGKRHQELNTTPVEPDSTHGRQASSSSASHRRSNSCTRYNPLERPPSPNPSSTHLAPHCPTTHHRRGRSLSSSRASGEGRGAPSGEGQRMVGNRNRNEADLIAMPVAASPVNVNLYGHLATTIPQSPGSLTPSYLNTTAEQTIPFAESHYVSPTEDLSIMFSNNLSPLLDVQQVAYHQPSHRPSVYSQYGPHNNYGNYRSGPHGRPDGTRRNEYS